ncbi:hypothetical protein [Limnobacter sp.]|uniref:hypothetical protein n=1 Tax=Limnobacter sp. TaxID=2003368 RepID=UPI003515771B
MMKPRAWCGAGFAWLIASLLTACSAQAPGELFPLQQGQRWDYRLQYDMPNGKRKETLHIEALGEASFYGPDGQQVQGHVRQTSQGTDYFISKRDDGYYRVGKRVVVQHKPVADAQARMVLPRGKNLRVGYTWTLETSPYVLHWMPPFDQANASIKPFDMVYQVVGISETVQTPLGIFENCVKVHGEGTLVFYADASAGYQEVLVNHTEWYAPGVGLVKLLREEPLNTDIMKGGKVEMLLVAHQR